MSKLSSFEARVQEGSSSELSFGESAARDVYFDLFDGRFGEVEQENGAHFLSNQLAFAARVTTDLPDETSQLEAWMHESTERVGGEYQAYLDERKAGGARRYFQSRSHALNFLKGVAPTKLVDGAWLYGLLPRWSDPRFTALIQTYLEELGEGLPTKNHVVLYRKLLAKEGLEKWDELSDEHFVQGAIQLALAYNAERFLPEIIGYNLGYEQLPLHLLITSYELKELAIDPYYFVLHVTVDNADSGHARKAVDAISDTMPRLADADDWWRRVQNGYALNYLGANTTSVIESYDPETEMLRIFARKSSVGQFAHSDYRRVGERTVNEWLSEPSDMAEFTEAMEREGWFQRGQDPQKSRFWRLIQSEKAKMFGVFSPYEQQVIYDWIAGEALQNDSVPLKAPGMPKREVSFDARQLILEASGAPDEEANTDFGDEVRELQELLSSAQDRDDAMAKLIELLSPANHHSAAGLMATRIFNDVLV